MVTRFSCDGREVLDKQGSCVAFEDYQVLSKAHEQLIDKIKILEAEIELTKITIGELNRRIDHYKADN